MATPLCAQKQYSLKIEPANGQKSALLNHYSYKKIFSDSLSRNDELKSFISVLQSEGYLTCSIDSLVFDSLNLRALITAGNKYKWIKLSPGNIEKNILTDAGWKETNFSDKPIRINRYLSLNEKIIKYFENSGFPFASVALDSISFSDSTLSAAYNLKKNSLIKVDSIIIKGKLKGADKFLFNYLELTPGMIYNESKISRISGRLKELQFLREIKPFHVIFFKETAKLYLYLDKKKNSRFDGILGIAPNNTTSGKVLLTGELNLELENAFSKAEQLSLKWRKLQLSSQDLKLNLVYPYIFNLPFGVDGKFKLYKNDTLYLTLTGNYGLRYLFSGTDYFKGFYENTSSILLSTQAYKNATKLPDFADVSSNLYGLEIRKKKLDYLLNPRKGYTLLFSAATGNRKIKKNAVFNDTLYSGLKLNTVQYKTEIGLEYYHAISANTVVKIGVNAAAVFSDKLFENELFLIGGLKTLRGFDEESISASQYLIPYIEYRFLFEENSNIFLFFNQGFYRKKIQEKETTDKPLGFGAGVNFETKAGIFTLTYALGKQFSNPVDFKTAKIHFGIVSYF